MSLKPQVQKLVWTKHAQKKRKYYQLSKSRLLRVLQEPDRVEKGVAPGTIACMKKKGTEKNPWEIWLMYQKDEKKKKIISAWRYPGTSPKGEPPIPEDIREELDKFEK